MVPDILPRRRRPTLTDPNEILGHMILHTCRVFTSTCQLAILDTRLNSRPWAQNQPQKKPAGRSILHHPLGRPSYGPGHATYATLNFLWLAPAGVSTVVTSSAQSQRSDATRREGPAEPNSTTTVGKPGARTVGLSQPPQQRKPSAAAVQGRLSLRRARAVTKRPVRSRESEPAARGLLLTLTPLQSGS